MKLCCFFNYAPLYRQSIYKAIDENFDTQFYFGDSVDDNKSGGIARLDYAAFRRRPVTFRNKKLFGRFLWRTKCALLGLKRYDTFIVTGDSSFSYIPLLLSCKILGKRVFGWGHGIKTKGSGMKLFNNFLYRNLDGYLTYGEGGRRRLIELGFDPARIHVIYNSLSGRIKECPDLTSAVFKDHFGNDNPVLLFIGRLTPQKKLDWLVRALVELDRQGLKCNLVMIGTGNEESRLRELASELGVADRVWFYGECYDDSITSELIYNADLCVSPGNVGLTALHALSYGTPVISHDDFETQMPEYEVIDPGKTGMLYRKDDFADFCKAILTWLTDRKNSRSKIRRDCLDMINGKWNADHQIEVLKATLE